MFIEENKELVNIGLKEVEKLAKRLYGENFSVTERTLTFKLHPDLIGKDESGRLLTSKMYGILPTITIHDENNKTKHIQYYANKTRVKDVDHYTPQSVYFANGELELDLTGQRGGTPDYSLAYLLFQHPKLMKSPNPNQPGRFYLYRADESAASELEVEALKAEVDNYILYKNGRDYIKDDDIESACRKLGIAVVGHMSVPELRKELLTVARTNPKEFIAKIKRDGKFTEVVQEGLDMKVIVFDETKAEYYFTYRTDSGVYREKHRNSTPIHKIPPHGRGNCLKSFVDHLVHDDTEGNLALIEQGIADERKYLSEFPDRPQMKDINKAMKKMISEIVIQ